MVEEINGPDESEFLLGFRIIPVGREGSNVFVRNLRPGEEDTGEVVHIEAGDQITFLPGDLVIDSREIDSRSPKGLGGYAPTANTVWTWYRIVGEQVGFFCYLFALARRLDAAHADWALAIEELEKARNESGIGRRHRFFKALSLAEVAIIALGRGMDMLRRVNSVYSLGLEMPDSLQKKEPVVRAMRDAFEHIDERAQGKINAQGKMDADALSIFDQPDFIDSSILHYRGYDLNFQEDFLSALLTCRELVMEVVDLRAKGHSERRDGTIQ